jgi:hypothetical protein
MNVNCVRWCIFFPLIYIRNRMQHKMIKYKCYLNIIQKLEYLQSVMGCHSFTAPIVYSEVKFIAAIKCRILQIILNMKFFMNFLAVWILPQIWL